MSLLRLPQAVDCGSGLVNVRDKCMGPQLPLNLSVEIFSSNFEAKTQHEWAILLVCDNCYLGKEEFRIMNRFFSSEFLALKPLP